MQKLWEMERQIKDTEKDLIHIQKKIEKGKLEKARGKKSKPFKAAVVRDTAINEDCVNLSFDNVNQLNLIGADQSRILQDPNQSCFGGIGDKESSIHFDMTKNEMDPMDDRSSTSSVSRLNKLGSKKGANISSRLSQSGVSDTSGKGTKKKKTTTTSKAGGNISDTTSVKSGKSTKSKVSKAGGMKKKKKAGNDLEEKSVASDTSRGVIPPPVEEPKVEEPVIPERPKREFKESEKVRLMN